MDDLRKILGIVNERLLKKADLYTLRDLIKISKYEEDNEDIKEYLDMPVSQFLSLLKINILYENKRINEGEYLELTEELNNYYKYNAKIRELTYINYISDMDEYSDAVNSYYELKDISYNKLNKYNVMLNVIDDSFGDMYINNFRIRNKNCKIKRNIYRRKTDS